MSKNQNKVYDVAVVGGGYSGLVLAILCARAGLLVCLIEQNSLLGRKILSTGNGRCNFTNENITADCYNTGSSFDFSKLNYKESVSFLNELGVVEKNLNGYFYPYTNQASTVRDALEYEVNSCRNIRVFLNEAVTKIEKQDYFSICLASGQKLLSKNAVIATGGLAASSLGSSSIGYDTAKGFGLSVTKLSPALVGTRSNDKKLKCISGVRAQGIVSFEDHKMEGEIQFNKDGISGFPVMCISRFIGIKEIEYKEMALTIDFVPYLSTYNLKNELTKRFSVTGKTVSAALNGLANTKVLLMVLKEVNINENIAADSLSNKQLASIAEKLKQCRFSIMGTKGFEAAQVTCGGVSLNELDDKTMEARKVKGLYFIGEVTDVDGICGGYNLEWARYSASLAASNIIRG